jgi:hypothetical protein
MDTQADSSPPGQTRTGRGRYAEDPVAADRDLKVYDLRLRGRTFEAIAAELGIGQSTAHDAFKRVINARRVEASDDARQLERDRLQAALQRYDEREQQLHAMLKRKHIVVQHGKVVEDSTGNRITQLERLRDQVHQRMVDLDGLKVNPSQNVNMQIEYVVKGLDDD